MFSFNELKKNLKKDFSTLKKVKISVLGDSATQMFCKALRGYGYEIGYDFDIYEADYNQIRQEVLNPSSNLYEKASDIVIILFSFQKLKQIHHGLDKASKSSFAQDQLEAIENYYELIQDKLKAKVIISNVVISVDEVFGNYSSKVEESFSYQTTKFNYLLNELSLKKKNLSVLNVQNIQSYFGISEVVDPQFYISASMAFSLDFTTELAIHTGKIISTQQGKFKKCLILDLDNTTWGGIIGDDGIEGIQVGDLGIGKAFTELQKWALDLKRRGIILCICSKNTESVAKEPFEKHPEMVLRLDDISVFVANWEPKSDNIRYIQGILNIGFDSMVFLDDNPFERNIVRKELPEVDVPELPEDPAEYLTYINRLNLFETSSYSENDEKRTQQYQQESKRKKLSESFTNQGDYLKSLDMTSVVEGFTSFNTPRVAQLTQRSNQFNLRTKRYSEEDITNFSKSHKHKNFTFTLSDIYGESGLISIVILEIKENKAFIDTWIMSCRVLKRGMENFVLNNLVDYCKQNNIKTLVGEYLPTPKNKLVENHYKDLGFKDHGNSNWELSVIDYSEKEAHIKIK